MADITQLRFAQLLKRAFAVKALDPGRVLAPVITPSHEVADTYQPENRASRGEKLFTAVTNVSNTAATSFGIAIFVNNPGSNRIAVIKRATWSFNLPTAANQPGNVGVTITQPSQQGAFQTLIASILKDPRWGFPGASGVTASGLLNSTGGAAGFLGGLYSVQLFPGAAAVPTIHQVDNLDIALPPASQVIFRLTSDILPVATYTWTVCIEGYERTLDPGELVPPGS